MKIIYFTALFLLILFSCSINISKSTNQNKSLNFENYQKAISNGNIDSILKSYKIETIDSQKFLARLNTKNFKIITHSLSSTCGFSIDVLNHIKSTNKENDSILPILIITSPKDLEYDKLKKIMNTYEVKLYYQNSEQFHYYKYLKRFYKIKKPKLIYLIKNGQLLKNTNNLKDI
jgi:hypothetical protein